MQIPFLGLADFAWQTHTTGESVNADEGLSEIADGDLTHQVHIMEVNGESYRLKHSSRENSSPQAPVHSEGA